MNPHAVDTALALTGGITTGSVMVATNPGINPWVAQIVMPIVGAIVVPFLKDLSLIAIAALKRKWETKKKNKKGA